MRAMSSEPSWDSKWCRWAVGGVLGRNEGVGEAGGEWGGAEGFRNEVGRLDWVRANSDCPIAFGFCREVLMGWWVPPASRVAGAGWLLPLGVPLVPRSAGGTYRGGPVCVARVVARKRGRVASRSRDLFGFREGASCALGAGVGAEGGASGCVVGAWGVVPGVVGGVAGPGGRVVRCRGCVVGTRVQERVLGSS
jgi:hypothetical protein